MGTSYRRRDPATGRLTGEPLPVDYAAIARGFGAEAIETRTIAELRTALEAARATDRTTVITIATDPTVSVPSYDSWWDVPVAEVSSSAEVQRSRADYDQQRRRSVEGRLTAAQASHFSRSRARAAWPWW